MPRLPVLRRLRRAARDEHGGATIEFVILFVPLISLVLLVAQVSISHFFMISATNAAARGARLAAVLAPSHCAALRNSEGEPIYELDTDAFATIPEEPAQRYCLNEPSPCRPLAATTWRCTRADTSGAGKCDAEIFDAVAAEMSGPAIDPDAIEITYEDSRLGEVGGRVVPLVTVSVTRFDVSFRSLFWEAEAELPAISATTVGEGMGYGRAQQKPCV